MRWRELVSKVVVAGIASGAVAACSSSDDGGGAGTEADDGASATAATEVMDDTGTLGGLDDTTGPVPPDMGLQPPTVCESACANRAGCGASEVACLNQCDADYATFMETSSACVADFEALLACLSGSTCEELDTYDSPGVGEAYPCQAEDDAFTTSCLLGGEPPPATCDAYCAVIGECAGLAPNECAAVCSMQLTFAEGLGDECLAATTMQLDCVGTLECTDYEAFDLQEGDYSCMTETTAVDEACGM